MILSSTQKVQVILAGAITTAQLAVSASWAEIMADGSTFAPDNIETNTNSTTAVDVVAAAATGYKRQVKELAVYNADTVAATVTVRVDTSGTARIHKKVTLQTGEQLHYNDRLGWRVFAADGAERGAGGTSTSVTDLIVAISDESTAITTGTAKVTFRAPRAMTISKIKASLSTSSSSGNPAFDVNKNGVSMFSTTLTIDSGEKTSETAATAAVLSSTTLAADDEVTIDIDTAGTGAKGAKITFVATT